MPAGADRTPLPPRYATAAEDYCNVLTDTPGHRCAR